MKFHIFNPCEAEFFHIDSYIAKNLEWKMFDVQGPVQRKFFQSITNKMQRYTICLFLETALHVSGGIWTYHQEHTQP